MDDKSLEHARRRCLRRALFCLPMAVLLIGVGFGMEAMGWGTTQLLELPLHVWVKLPGLVALVIGAISMRGYLNPDHLKPLF